MRPTPLGPCQDIPGPHAHPRQSLPPRKDQFNVPPPPGRVKYPVHGRARFGMAWRGEAGEVGHRSVWPVGAWHGRHG